MDAQALKGLKDKSVERPGKRDMVTGETCKTPLQPSMQANNIKRFLANKVLSLQVCVSFHDSTAA